MAYVARRPKGRFEIRESVHTPKGPRSRSLATFTVLDDDVLGRAAAASTSPLVADEVRASARRAGATIAPSAANDYGRRLLRELRAGHRPSPGLRRLLLDALREERAPRLDAGDSIADWVGASADERGEALRDLLALTDQLPQPRGRRTALTYPRLDSRE